MGSSRLGGAELTLAGATGRIRERWRRRPRRAPGRRGLLRRLWPLWLAVVVLFASLLFVVEPVHVSSDSMSPTFHAGDQLLVDKVGHRAHHPNRRDIIAFHLPGSGSLLVKRVVGVAGDSVGLEDGVLVVNGQALHEPFVDYNLMDATYFGPVVVPAGTVFTMGDNRSNSIDSRRFGPIPTRDIVGRVIARIWPPG